MNTKNLSASVLHHQAMQLLRECRSAEGTLDQNALMQALKTEAADDALEKIKAESLRVQQALKKTENIAELAAELLGGSQSSGPLSSGLSITGKTLCLVERQMQLEHSEELDPETVTKIARADSGENAKLAADVVMADAAQAVRNMFAQMQVDPPLQDADETCDADEYALCCGAAMYNLLAELCPEAEMDVLCRAAGTAAGASAHAAHAIQEKCDQGTIRIQGTEPLLDEDTVALISGFVLVVTFVVLMVLSIELLPIAELGAGTLAVLAEAVSLVSFMCASVFGAYGLASVAYDLLSALHKTADEHCVSAAVQKQSVLESLRTAEIPVQQRQQATETVQRTIIVDA